MAIGFNKAPKPLVALVVVTVIVATGIGLAISSSTKHGSIDSANALNISQEEYIAEQGGASNTPAQQHGDTRPTSSPEPHEAPGSKNMTELSKAEVDTTIVSSSPNNLEPNPVKNTSAHVDPTKGHESTTDSSWQRTNRFDSAETRFFDNSSSFRSEEVDPLVNCPVGRNNNPSRYMVHPVGDRYTETSYMAFSRQMHNSHPVLWIGSDGSQDTLSAVDVETGGTIRTYKLGVDGKGDWEAMSLGPCSSRPNSPVCIYVGNVGNNRATRCRDKKCRKGRDLVFAYKFEEPNISQPYNGTTIGVTTLALNYHHEESPTNRANCAAMFVDFTGDNEGGKPGDIYFVTKFRKVGDLVRLTKMPVEEHEDLELGVSSPYSLLPVSEIYGGKSWTGSDMTIDGNLIALRDNDGVYFFPRLPTHTVAGALQQEPCPFMSPRTRDSKYAAVAMMGTDIMAEASECDSKKACIVEVTAYSLQYKKRRRRRLGGLA